MTALSAHFTLASGITAACGLLVLSALAWSFFFFGVTALQGGLEKLLRAKAVRAIRDTVGFLPFLTVTGVTVISGALSIAIAHPEGLLPTVSAVSFGGGLALFFLTNALISLRFGMRRARCCAGRSPPSRSRASSSSRRSSSRRASSWRAG